MNFTTVVRHRAAEFHLNFAQSYINDVEKLLARKSVALLLSLPL